MKKQFLIFFILLALLAVVASCQQSAEQMFEIGATVDNTCSINGVKSKEITSIDIPDECDGRQVKYIGRNAFEGCENLVNVTIPEGVEVIREYAFIGCVNLESVSLPNSIKEIEYKAFDECPKLKFKTYENGKYLGNDDNPYVLLVSGIDDTVETFKVNENCKIIYCKALTCYRQLKTIDMPYSILYIGAQAFEGCSSLETFLVPNFVKHFSASWLNHCSSLKTITISANVETVEIGYMWGCESFSEFIVYTTNSKFASKDGVLYSKDLKALLAYPRAKKGDSFAIPSYVERIATYAFNGCDYLKTISMWPTVKYISSGAVINCDLLHTVKYYGTMSEWVALDNSNRGWDHSFCVNKVYCSDGTISRSKA